YTQCVLHGVAPWCPAPCCPARRGPRLTAVNCGNATARVRQVTTAQRNPDAPSTAGPDTETARASGPFVVARTGVGVARDCSIPLRQHAAQGVVARPVVVEQRRRGVQADQVVAARADGFVDALQRMAQVL